MRREHAPQGALGHRARRETLQYLMFSFGFAWAFQIAASLLLARGALMAYQLLLAASMFCPLAAVLLVRRLEELDSAGIRWKPQLRGKMRYWLAALWGAALVTLLGSALYFALFPARLDWEGSYLAAALGESGMAQLEAQGLTPMTYFIAALVQAVTFAPFINMFLAVGEEAGWRGFLYPRLKRRFGAVRGQILGGVIWGMWHWPVMLLSGYEYGKEYPGAPFAGPLLFCAVCTVLGILLDWLYEKTGCIWAPALAHGAFNAAASLPAVLTKVEYADQMILGPAPIGLIGMLPMLALAAGVLLAESKKKE